MVNPVLLPSTARRVSTRYRTTASRHVSSIPGKMFSSDSLDESGVIQREVGICSTGVSAGILSVAKSPGPVTGSC